MYDTKYAKLPNNVTLDYILSKVTEYDIYSAFLGRFKVGMIYNSPFRKDRNPSFGCYYSRKDKSLLFKDHGTGESGGVLKFVSLITGITDYNELLKHIVEKLKITKDTHFVSSKHYIQPTETVIGIVRQPFTNIDLEYWGQFGIKKETLKKFDVNSIKYYLCNGIVKSIYKDENPMYAYKVYNRFKIYKPYADKFTKWRNNLTEYDIQGLKQLPKTGGVLVITKSLKDVMCLYEMGIPAISPSSESTFIPDRVLRDILRRFKTVLILFDRDAAGVNYLRKMSLKTGLRGILMHKKFKAKDVSDAILINGFDKVKKFIYDTITKVVKQSGVDTTVHDTVCTEDTCNVVDAVDTVSKQ